MMTRLYYEAHITVAAATDFARFADVSRHMGWRASKFDEDEVDDMSGYWFLSFRDPNLTVAKRHVHEELRFLREQGFKPVRWKIEDTVLDSKHGDSEALLTAA
jgi:hypothetical protein